MNFFKKLLNLFKKDKQDEKDCKHDEYCPIYLSYLDKYNSTSSKLKYCKNSNKQYCTKYRLLDQTEWKKLNEEEKLNIIKEMHLIEFIDKD
jgi:hypothetical protein